MTEARLIALQLGILAIGMAGLGRAFAASRLRARKREEAGLLLAFLPSLRGSIRE